jgi:hypothetical protein
LFDAAHRSGVTVGSGARLFGPAIIGSAGDSFASCGQPSSDLRDKPDFSKSAACQRPQTQIAPGGVPRRDPQTIKPIEFDVKK